MTVKGIVLVPCGLLAEAGVLRLDVPMMPARIMQIAISDRSLKLVRYASVKH